MNKLEAVRERYLEHKTKLMIAANTSDADRKARCLATADFYLKAADAIDRLIVLGNCRTI